MTIGFISFLLNPCCRRERRVHGVFITQRKTGGFFGDSRFFYDFHSCFDRTNETLGTGGTAQSVPELFTGECYSILSIAHKDEILTMTKKEFGMVEAAAEIEKELALPTNFLWNLRKADDWSAIIKLHALLETAVTHLLVRYFGRDELEDVFANMELGNARTGKLVFLTKLNCLDKNQRRFIRKLSATRNKLVHDIRNVRFSFPEYVKELTVDQYKAFVDDLGILEEKTPPREWVQENSKTLFVFAGIGCLASIYLEKKQAMLKQNLIRQMLSSFGLK
jgi:hypothetical protein